MASQSRRLASIQDMYERTALHVSVHHHGSYGYTTESCSAEKAEVGKRSYANAAKRRIVIDLEPHPRLVPDSNADRQPTDPSNPPARPRSDDAPIDSVRPTEIATRPRSPPQHGAGRCAPVNRQLDAPRQRPQSTGVDRWGTGGRVPPFFRVGGQHRNCPPPHFSFQKYCEAYSLTQHSSLLIAATYD